MSQLLSNLTDFISELNTLNTNIDIVLATKYRMHILQRANGIEDSMYFGQVDGRGEQGLLLFSDQGSVFSNHRNLVLDGLQFIDHAVVLSPTSGHKSDILLFEFLVDFKKTGAYLMFGIQQGAVHIGNHHFYL